MSKFKTLSKAKESFSQSKFRDAMNQFGQVLQNYPNSKEAFNGVILSEMALSGEGGAEALFDYYEVLKEEDRESADIIMNDILQNMDDSLEQLSEIFTQPLKERLEYEDGILYEDFKVLIESGNSFKETFENIMFSTKVIITRKEDFLNFLDNLIENNFTEMALSYLENALSIYPSDEILGQLVDKLSEKGKIFEN
jgi:tetratricopeptide (TPR) repeat protein